MSNIRTLGSTRKSGSGSDSEGDDEHRQGFFVGGSEHSGQQVLGPPDRRGRNNANVTERVFEAARAAGAEMVNLDEERQRGRPSRGARLDGAAGGGGSDTDEPPQREVRLTMWTNGFSIDDGPLRSFEDADSRQFLQDIMQGHIPMELRRQYPNEQIDLRMERKTEEYKAPKAKPFGGTGHRLGAVVPNLVSSEASSSVAGGSTHAVAPQQPTEDLIAKAQADVALDEAAPISQIQARLPAGNRVVGRFNHTHTVSAVRNFLVSACPELAFTPFQLMTTFPNKVVDDETLSLKDAGLINAVVVVKPIV